MTVAEAYLMKTSNVDEYFNSIQAGQAPERFTYKFLEQIGFSSSNDRLYIKLLKELGFLDPSGVPTQRYFEFLDQSEAGAVLAEAIVESYSDLFTINKKAYEMSEATVVSKLKTLTQGKKSQVVIKQTAKTFMKLCDYADWEAYEIRKGAASSAKPPEDELESAPDQAEEEAPASNSRNTISEGLGGGVGLHYNIQIHLPESRDSKVYDAIFEALRKHLAG